MPMFGNVLKSKLTAAQGVGRKNEEDRSKQILGVRQWQRSCNAVIARLTHRGKYQVYVRNRPESAGHECAHDLLRLRVDQDPVGGYYLSVSLTYERKKLRKKKQIFTELIWW